MATNVNMALGLHEGLLCLHVCMTSLVRLKMQDLTNGPRIARGLTLQNLVMALLAHQIAEVENARPDNDGPNRLTLKF